MSEAEWLALQFVDAGPSGWNADNSLTAREIGLLTPARLLSIPGSKGEHLLFRDSPIGRYAKAKWTRFVSSIRKNGVKKRVTIHREKTGVWIHEGNHRIRAAFIAQRLVPVEISYFGNTQKQGYLFPDVVRTRG